MNISRITPYSFSSKQSFGAYFRDTNPNQKNFKALNVYLDDNEHFRAKYYLEKIKTIYPEESLNLVKEGDTFYIEKDSTKSKIEVTPTRFADALKYLCDDSIPETQIFWGITMEELYDCATRQHSIMTK